MTAYLVFFLIQALIFAVVCLGLNLQWGYTGCLLYTSDAADE